MNRPEKAIVVYGASSEQIDHRFKDDAFRLGQLIADAGYALVCGGGKAGLMRAAIEGADSRGGYTIGVLPQFMVEKQWQHPALSEMIATPDMHSRKSTMASLSNAAIACPGGCGTFEELMEIITWRQLNLYHGHVVILNTGGYYDNLIDMLRHSTDCGFITPESNRIWHVAATPEEAIAMATLPPDPTDYSRKIH